MGIMAMKLKSSGLEGLGAEDRQQEEESQAQPEKLQTEKDRLPGKGVARGKGIPSN